MTPRVITPDDCGFEIRYTINAVTAKATPEISLRASRVLRSTWSPVRRPASPLQIAQTQRGLGERNLGILPDVGPVFL